MDVPFASGARGSGLGRKYIPGGPAEFKKTAEPMQGNHVFNAVDTLGLKIIALVDAKKGHNPEKFRSCRATLSDYIAEFAKRRVDPRYACTVYGGKSDPRNSQRYGVLDAKTVKITADTLEGRLPTHQGHLLLVQMERYLSETAVDSFAKEDVRERCRNKLLFDRWYEETFGYIEDIFRAIVNLIDAASAIE